LESWDGWGHDYNVTRSNVYHGLSVDAKLNGKYQWKKQEIL